MSDVAKSLEHLYAQADADAAADWEAFMCLHPNAGEFEPLMVRYSSLIDRGALSWPLYLEVLYFLATRFVYESTKAVRLQ